MTDAAELLDVLPRYETAHGALLAAIVDVLRGEPNPSIDRERLVQPEELSPSELRVLRYLPTNLTRPEIARELYVSINTVNTTPISAISIPNLPRTIAPLPSRAHGSCGSCQPRAAKPRRRSALVA
jgi:hypothetical protein